MTADLFAPAPGLVLSLEGPRGPRRHFRAEYGAALAADAAVTGDAQVRVAFEGAHDGAMTDGVEGGHKSVRWTVALGDPSADPLTARVALRGLPRRFALSLVQGFVVEPLVSVAAARAGHVLLPAGGLVSGDGVVILLGRSGAGKTSVVASALAASRPALGDDQVILSRQGAVWPWPRRLRVYSDLRATAPDAVRSLGAGRRATLRALGVLRAATRGWVAPSLPLRWSELGAQPVAGPVPARRVVVVERSGAAESLVAEPVSGEAVTAMAGEILREQRERFTALAGPRWTTALDDAEQRERELLASVLAGLPAERWSVPENWPAPRAVGALVKRLGVEG